MTKRSTWCDFDKETRKYIKKRDKNECVICHSKGALQIMHIFISRAHGGKGSKENGCLGCVKCHRILDNYFSYEKDLHDKYLEHCKKYLIEKERIILNKAFLGSLEYKKSRDSIFIPETQKNLVTGSLGANKCKLCIYCHREKSKNNNLPYYYCVLTKKITSKNKICENFKKVE